MKGLNLYNIIFSDNRSWRWKRHFLFWLAFFLYGLVRISMIYPEGQIWESRWSLLEMTFFWGIILNGSFSYIVIYFLVPKYFHRKKYFLFTTSLLLMSITLFLLATLHQAFLNPAFYDAVQFRNLFDNISLFNRAGIIRFFGNPPLICCLLLSLKTLKNWHLEQLKTEVLAKENTNAELQLLKAQVHPHFLFNTLNNIYSFSLNQSPQAGTLVQRLSDMLHYMIHECKEPLVPLEREIKLIQDYMGLEKVRYGNRLNMQVEIKGEYKSKMIAPLLMIPFVENCFKHGASVMRGQQWIKLEIDINADQLELKLSNSKPQDATDINNKKGIGLANVQKRLQLLYPGNHFLKIDSASDTFNIHLQVSLQKAPALDRLHELIPKLQTA